MPQKLEDITLRSEEVQELLTKVPHWMIRYGNLVLLLLILLVLCISWFVKYPDVILAEALITTEIPPEKIYAKSTGKIQAILVKNNQKVTSNQPLAILENTANYQDIFKLKSIIDSIQINHHNFNFPIDSIPLLFLGDIEAQYALFENSYIQYKLNKELAPFSNEATANRYSLSELNRRLQNLESQRGIHQSELAFKEKDLKRALLLFNKGVISEQEYENKQLAYTQVERNFHIFKTSISQIRETISNARKTSKNTDINRVKEEITLLKNTIQTFNQLKTAIKNWELQYVLQSGITGNVSFLNVWNTHQAVKQGDVVFTIVPTKNSAFIAQLKSTALNSGKIKVGQNVHIKLENYPNTEFGMLRGTVKTISFTPNEKGQYGLIASLPDTLTTSYGKNITFKQEMVGSAEIITEDLRLIERFFYQLRNKLNNHHDF